MSDDVYGTPQQLIEDLSNHLVPKCTREEAPHSNKTYLVASLGFFVLSLMADTCTIMTVA